MNITIFNIIGSFILPLCKVYSTKSMNYKILYNTLPMHIMSSIYLLHILPNVVAPIIVIASVNIGRIIITETAMSFLGLGVPPPYPSWGSMLSGDAMRYFDRAWWLVAFPMGALCLTVFSMNMFGDALRDVLDPRLRSS